VSAVQKPALRFAPLRSVDLDAVSAIEASIYEFPWTLGNFRDSLHAGYSCWGCWGNEVLAAYAIAMFAAGEAHLLNISVAPASQGCGVGFALLDYVMLLGKERHCDRMLLEVRPSNLVARQLYARTGFQEVGRRKSYYPAVHGREDALLLERML
jgi:[ribosomal protein S18]-alanine N-acetyltransferase